MENLGFAGGVVNQASPELDGFAKEGKAWRQLARAAHGGSKLEPLGGPGEAWRSPFAVANPHIRAHVPKRNTTEKQTVKVRAELGAPPS